MRFKNCVKYIFALFNAITFLAGVAFFVSGILLLLDSGIMDPSVISLLVMIDYSSTIRYGIVLMNAGYILIATGSILTVVSVLGIFSAWKNTKACISMYIVALVLVILLQATMVGLIISLNGRSDSWLQGEMTTLLKDYEGPLETDATSEGFNKLFTKAHCCGVDSYTDFQSSDSVWYNNTGGTKYLPETCCKGVETYDEISQLIDTSSDCPTTPKDYYTQGCYTVIRKEVFTYMLIITTVSAAGLLLEITSIVLGICIMNKSKNRVRQMNVIRAFHSPSSPSHALPPPYIGLEAFLSAKGKI